MIAKLYRIGYDKGLERLAAVGKEEARGEWLSGVHNRADCPAFDAGYMDALQGHPRRPPDAAQYDRDRALRRWAPWAALLTTLVIALGWLA